MKKIKCLSHFAVLKKFAVADLLFNNFNGKETSCSKKIAFKNIIIRESKFNKFSSGILT